MTLKLRKFLCLLVATCLLTVAGSARGTMWASYVSRFSPGSSYASLDSPLDRSPSDQRIGADRHHSQGHPAQHLAQLAEADESLTQGQVRYELSEFAEAARLFQQAADAYGSQRNITQQAVALSNLALAQGQLGNWAGADEALATSLSLVSGAAVPVAVSADILNIQGQLQFAKGEFQPALDTWVVAQQRYEQAGDTPGAIKAQFNQAQALQMLGFYRRAIEILAALKQTLDAQPGIVTVSVLRSLGDALRVIGVYGEDDLGSRILTEDLNSEAVLKDALAMAEVLEQPQAIAQVQISLGDTRRSQLIRQFEERSSNNLERAEYDPELVEQALSDYRDAEQQATSPATRVQAQLGQLAVLVQAEQFQAAAALVNPIEAQLRSLPERRQTLHQELELVDALIAISEAGGEVAEPDSFDGPAAALPDSALQGEFAPALTGVPRLSPAEIAQRLARLSQRAEVLGDTRAQAQALGTLGTLYKQNQQDGDAQNLLQEALQLSQAGGAADLSYRWQWELAQLYVKAGQRDKAIAAYDNTIKTIARVQLDLATTSPELRFSFRDSIEPIHREYVSLLLAENPTPFELNEARKTIESLQLAELNNFFREACLNANAIEIDQVDQRAAVIYPIILENRFDVIVSLPQAASDAIEADSANSDDEATQVLLHHTIRSDSGDSDLDIRRTAKNLRLLVEDRFFFEFSKVAQQEFERRSEELYEWIIEPFEAQLEAANTETLVFVLDSGLRNLPMSVLFDGEQFLIEKYNVALTPGLQLLEAGNTSGDDIDLLIGGATRFNDVPLGSSEATRQPFTDLPGVEREIDAIKGIITDTQVLFNEDFTKPEIRQNVNAQSARVVHFATHGNFGSTQEDTYIVAWDALITSTELGQLLRSSELDRPDPVELLVLSACQTALGDDRAALGLAGIAVRSGARSTLGTLWVVDDESTSQLMVEFYRQWATGTLTKAEALRNAQLQLLTGPDPKFHSPYYWSPFVLVGNWL